MEVPNDLPSAEQAKATTDAENSPEHHQTINCPVEVSWYGQFMALVRWKTLPSLSRKPMTMTFMLLSSVVSVILSSLAGDNVDHVAPVDQCGAPDPDFFKVRPVFVNETYWNWYANETNLTEVTYRTMSEGGIDYSNSAAISINDNWQNGVPVMLLSMGPLMTALIVYFVVHTEIRLDLFGIIRGLGVRDSAYWMSWFIPFAVLAMVNSLLGAVTAKIVAVHVYQNVYFGGLFATLWFLQCALISSSMFAAAVTGKGKRMVIFWVIVFLIGFLLPWAVTFFSSWPVNGVEAVTSTSSSGISGLFWYNRHTTMLSFNYLVVDNSEEEVSDNWQEEYFTQCNSPLMADDEFNNYKTTTERQTVPTDDFYVGCYAQTGIAALLWDLHGSAKLSTVALYFVPYFHLYSIFGNFLGFTSDQQNKFTIQEAGLSTARLVSETRKFENIDSNLAFLNGALLTIKSAGYRYSDTNCEIYNEEYGYCEQWLNNCAENPGYNICSPISDCSGGRTIDAPSVHVLFLHLLLLTVFYGLMAGYWGIAFVSGNQRFYFPFLWNYWFVKSNIAVREERSWNVEVKSVAKSYGAVAAVKDVSLNLERGEITALLGHNGAGKTTLSNMIICETPPTGGDILVLGRSVKADSYSVRRMVGVCKQDDYLWPDLTAREHLFLFAELNGLAKDEEGKIVQEWLESVDLDLVQDQFSRQFSGGMKRRLSLALSTIGGRPLIVLDEPTTGMDPSSRRFVWKHIDFIKKDRVLLLTTHSMEEADLLADQVAIMKDGVVAARGTPLELKSRYGSALQFNILVEDSSLSAVTESIRTLFSGSIDFVKISAEGSGNITVNVLAVAHADVSAEGVELSTLIDFVTWLENGGDSTVLEYGFSNSSLEEVFLKVTDMQGPVDTLPDPLVGENTNDEPILTRDQTGHSIDVSATNSEISVPQQLEALMYHHITRGWTGRRSIASWASIVFLTALVANMGTLMALTTTPHIGGVVPCIVMSLLALSICYTIFNDRSDGLFYLMRSQGLMSISYVLSLCLYATLIGLVFSVLVLTIYYATPVFRTPDLCNQGSDDFNWCDPKFGDKPIIDYPEHIPIQMELNFPSGSDSSPSLEAFRSPSGYGPILVAALVFGLSFPGIVLASSYLPGNKFALVVISVLLLSSSITPVLHQVFSVVNNVYQGDESYQMFTQACLQRVAPTRDCFGDIFNGITTINLDNITEDDLNCIGAKLSSLDWLCQPLVVGLLPQYALFQMLSAALYWRISFVSESPELVELLQVRLSASGLDCVGLRCDFPFVHKYFWKVMGYEVLGIVILLLLGIFVSMVFSFPPEFILRSKKRIIEILLRKNQSPDKSGAVCGTDLIEVLEERQLVEAIVKDFVEITSSGSVKLKNDEIPRDKVPPVLIHKLRKVYPSIGKLPPKVALGSLDLQVSYGEVIGLLGKNGAGKTTALKILAAAHDATDGVGLMAGYDVGVERLAVFARMGNCAQFDVIWPRLTVKEHLVFFTRLKGAPRNQVQSSARNIATAVGLGSEEVYNRPAGNLSGGMRRRLSIAISLVASPKVLILDEPTTGLDPATRKNIWELITSLSTPERAIVLTTHQMIEADTLCSRIAIIAKGKLVAVGTQQHLKSKFGSGFILQLNLVHNTLENEATALSFCRDHLHSEATKESKQAKTLHVRLPPNLNLQKAFAALYDPNVRPGCINQFLLNQSSLEDVFIALGDGFAGEVPAVDNVVNVLDDDAAEKGIRVDI